jgi:hypothetical protein
MARQLDRLGIIEALGCDRAEQECDRIARKTTATKM